MQSVKERNSQIGIVIIGRNEGDRLRRCLESVVIHNVPVVYVDSNSSDGSPELALSMNVEVSILDNSRPVNASRGRNEGFNLLMEKYPYMKYVHFIDGDCEMDPGWLASACEVLDKRPDVAVVCGLLREKDHDISAFKRLNDMEWYIPPGEIARCGGIATIRSSVYSDVSGYDESLIAGADPELYFRIRKKDWKILCIDTKMGIHDSGMSSFKQWWTRCIKGGYAMADAGGWGYYKERRSTWIWTIIIPLAIIILAILTRGFGLIAFMIYPLQIFRISIKKRRQKLEYKDAILYASFCVLAKVPQFQGLIRHLKNKLKSSQATIIEYKKI